MLNEDIYSKAIEKFGHENQLIVAIEELSELQKELTKALRGKLRIEKLLEEIADVEIILEQLKLMYSDCQIEKLTKISRLKELIDGKQ